MTITNNKILDEVLSLPNNMRADLIEILIESLNLPAQSEVDKLWADEAENRINALEKGIVNKISGEEVIKEIKGKYKT